jgi:hypothetical protein
MGKVFEVVIRNRDMWRPSYRTIAFFTNRSDAERLRKSLDVPSHNDYTGTYPDIIEHKVFNSFEELPQDIINSY